MTRLIYPYVRFDRDVRFERDRNRALDLSDLEGDLRTRMVIRKREEAFLLTGRLAEEARS